MKKKNFVSQITIDVAEGHAKDCVLHTFTGTDAFDQADTFVRRYISAGKAPDLGYNKTDAKVIWDDGESYAFRFDIDRDTKSFSEEVFRALSINAGIKPPGFPQDRFDRIQAMHDEASPTYRAEYAEFVKDRQLLPLGAGTHGDPYGIPYSFAKEED